MNHTSNTSYVSLSYYVGWIPRDTYTLYFRGRSVSPGPVLIPLCNSTFKLGFLNHYHSFWYSVLLYSRIIVELGRCFMLIGLHICKHDIRDTIQAILTRGHNGDMKSAIHLTNISSSILDYPLRMYTHLCSWPHGACILTSNYGLFCSVNSCFRSILTSFWNVYSPMFLTSLGDINIAHIKQGKTNNASCYWKNLVWMTV